MDGNLPLARIMDEISNIVRLFAALDEEQRGVTLKMLQRAQLLIARMNAKGEIKTGDIGSLQDNALSATILEWLGFHIVTATESWARPGRKPKVWKKRTTIPTQE